MTLKYPERVQETTTSTGTGDLVLLGAPDSSYNAFSARCSNGDTTDVAIFGAGAFELCRATYNTGANSITRGAIYDSSNGGSRVNFGAGTKTVVVGPVGALWAILLARSDEIVAAIEDVASASTSDIGAAASWRVRITGTTAITSFGSGANKLRSVIFAGALVLTRNATSLILPTGADITTAAGDTAWFQSDGSGNWRCLSYQRADGTSLAIPSGVLRHDVAQSLTSGQKAQVQENAGLPALLRGLTSGLTTTWASTTSITTAAGAWPDDTLAVILTLASAMTKTTGSWAAGDGNGGKLEAAAMANNTWYYWFIIAKADRTTDIGFSTSATSPTLPSGYTYKRLFWATKTDGSAQFHKYFQRGRKCKWDQFFTEVGNVNVTVNTAYNVTLAGAPPIAGIEASGPCALQSLATGGNLYVTSQDQTDTTTSFSGANAFNVATPNSTAILRASGWWSVFPSATGGIRWRVNARDGDTYAFVETSEWQFPVGN